MPRLIPPALWRGILLLQKKIKNKLKIDFNKIKVYNENTEKGGGPVAIELLPDWMTGLEEEDVSFIKKFILASGSLKEVAAQYGVTYPTVRLRLDRLIQKIRIGEDTAADPYIATIKRLVVNDKLDFDTAKLLIAEYKRTKGTDLG